LDSPGHQVASLLFTPTHAALCFWLPWPAFFCAPGGPCFFPPSFLVFERNACWRALVIAFPYWRPIGPSCASIVAGLLNSLCYVCDLIETPLTSVLGWRMPHFYRRNPLVPADGSVDKFMRWYMRSPFARGNYRPISCFLHFNVDRSTPTVLGETR